MDLIALSLAQKANIKINKSPSASRRFGYKIGWCGDSITNGSSSTNASVFSFRAVTQKLLGYRVTFDSVNGGVPGDRSDQLLARMDGIIAQGVDVLSVMIGTNDAPTVSLPDYQANILKIKDKADAAGLPIIFSLVPPRGSGASDSLKQNINTYNLWLRFWTASHGIPLVDTFSALVDPTTGEMLDDYDSGDGTHPNNAGHAEIATALFKVLDGLLPKMPWPVTNIGGGLANNPLIADDTGWFAAAGATATRSVVTPDPDTGDPLPAGNWMRFTLNNSAGGSAVNTTQCMSHDTTGYAAGDKLLLCMWVNAPNGKIQILSGSTVLSVPFDSIGVCKKVPFLIPYTVPVGGGALRFGFNFTAAAGATETFDVGAADLYNLTTLGLTDIDL